MIRFILTAALVGGALQYIFGESRKPAPRRRTARAGDPRRKRSRAARPAASSPR